MTPNAGVCKPALFRRDPFRAREYSARISESLRCVRQDQPYRRQRDLLAQERETSVSLRAARGDGARLCPPKAQQSPPPRDLVQRSPCVLLFVLCALFWASQSTKYQVQTTKYQVLPSPLRLLPCTDRRACGL